MDFARYNEIKQHLLHAMNLAAPDSHVQRAIVAGLTEMEVDNKLSPEAMLAQIVGWFHDGLAYGNWPGTVPKTISEA